MKINSTIIGNTSYINDTPICKKFKSTTESFEYKKNTKIQLDKYKLETAKQELNDTIKIIDDYIKDDYS